MEHRDAADAEKLRKSDEAINKLKIQLKIFVKNSLRL